MLEHKVLFLNASNTAKFPVYPYAFIQVPAIARQSGIEAICKDMLGIPHQSWRPTIQTLIAKHNPAMILITLRNTDSLDSGDYLGDDLDRDQNAYFPIERTRELIAAIREISDLKIALGGFGFSLLPDELMRSLRPDLGVYEGPNDFFARFDEVKNGNLDTVANLLFFQDGRLISNPRTLYPPLADAEYTPQAIQAMLAFYDAFPSPGFQGAPVEIMRGCNHACVFCAEPHGKGAQVRYRELSAVMRDIEMLANHGVTRIYSISSELNPEGNEFVLELADRIRSFNASRAKDNRITWHGANYLLQFESDEYERLYSSGFTGGWFDITALDDDNARAMRTPYRNSRLLTHLKIYVEHQKKHVNPPLAQKARGSEAETRAGDGSEDASIRWTMFLGNPATTIETIRTTLQIANRNGLSSLFDSCDLTDHIRVFDYEALDEATMAATYSVTLDRERTSYQQLLPSFAYPPALLRVLTEEEISEMFSHIAETYLSTKYQQTRDWHGFVNQRATAASISRWMAELTIKDMHPPIQWGQIAESATLDQLFTEKPAEGVLGSDASHVAKRTVDLLVSTCLAAFPDFFASLGLPSTADDLDRTTPYELAVGVFSRWESATELMAQTGSIVPEWQRNLLQFCVHAILYRYNIVLNLKYRPLFI